MLPTYFQHANNFNFKRKRKKNRKNKVQKEYE